MPHDYIKEAVILLKQHRFKEVIEICRKGLLSDPTSIQGRILLATALMALKQYKEAEDELKLLLKVNPNLTVVHRLLAELYLNLKEIDKAKKEIAIIEKLDPKEPLLMQLKSQLSLWESSKGIYDVKLEDWMDNPQSMTTFTETVIRLDESEEGYSSLERDPETTDSFSTEAESTVVDEDSLEFIKKEASELRNNILGSQSSLKKPDTILRDLSEVATKVAKVTEDTSSEEETKVVSEEETKVVSPKFKPQEKSSTFRRLPDISEVVDEEPPTVIAEPNELKPKEEVLKRIKPKSINIIKPKTEGPKFDPLKKPFWGQEKEAFDEFTFSIHIKELKEKEPKEKEPKKTLQLIPQIIPQNSLQGVKGEEVDSVVQHKEATLKVRRSPEVSPPPVVQTQHFPVEDGEIEPKTLESHFENIKKLQPPNRYYVAPQILEGKFNKVGEMRGGIGPSFLREHGKGWETPFRRLASSITGISKKIVLPGERTTKLLVVSIITLLFLIIISLAILLGTIIIKKREIETIINISTKLISYGNYTSYVEAYRKLNKLVELERNNPEFWVKLSWITSIVPLEFGEYIPDAKPEDIIDKGTKLGISEEHFLLSKSLISLIKGDLNKSDSFINLVLQKVNSRGLVSEAHYIKGVLHYKKGEFVQALREIEAASKVEPTEVRYKLAMIKIYMQQQNYEQANYLLDTLAQEYPQNVWIKLWKAYYIVTKKRDKSEAVDKEEAKKLLKELIESYSNLTSKAQLSWAYTISSELELLSGNLEGALSYMKLSSQFEPIGDDLYYFYKSNLFFMLGYLREAEENIKKAIALNQFREEYGEFLIKIYISSSRFNEAEELINKLKDSTKKQILAGELYFRQKKFETARKKFLGIPVFEGDMYTTARIYLALIEAETGNIDKAISQLEKLIGEQTENGEIYWWLVRLYIRKGELYKAKNIIEKGEETLPTSPYLFLAKAQLAMFQGELREGEAILRSMIERNPSFMEAYYILGEYYSSIGNYNEAQKLYDTLLKNDPNNTTILMEKAKVLAYKGDIEEAERIVRSIERKKEIPDELNLVKAIIETARFAPDKGLVYLEALLEKYQYDSTVISMLAYGYYTKYIKGGSKEQKLYNKAISLYKKLLLLDKDNIEAVCGLAELTSAENSAEAKEWSAKAQQLLEKNQLISPRIKARILFLPVYKAYDFGEYEKIRGIANKVLSIDPNFAPAYYFLGLVEEDVGSASGACQYFKKYIELAPEGIYKKDAKRGIDDNC